jgi:AcrR family transcriptional regulator
MKVETSFNLRIVTLQSYPMLMGAAVTEEARISPASSGKAPRTARGERTLRKILDAAREEFGERGFSDSSIVGITQRAGVALGTFYTYFDSKEALFKALVSDMSAQVRDHVAPALRDSADTLDGERAALESFLWFAREHRDVYRIIDEAEFVEPRAYREHYETTATRIAARLIDGRESGDIGAGYSDEELEILGWALMGANVFLGLRFSVWASTDPKQVADTTNKLLRSGLGK